MRRIRDGRERLVARCLGCSELLLGGAQLLLQPLQLRELLGRRLPLELRPAAQVVDARHQRAPALVGREQRVERLAGSLPGESGAPGVGLGAGCLEVDHASDSRYASITVATPSSSALGQTQSARSRSSGLRVLDRDPEAGFVDQLDVVLAVAERDDAIERDAEPLGDERDARSLRDGRVAELEQVGKRRRQEEPVAEGR